MARRQATVSKKRPDLRCHLCQAVVRAGEGRSHVAACLDGLVEGGPARVRGERGLAAFHLVATGRGVGGSYALHVEARADATLVDLDGVLRSTWVECCWHLSAFGVRGTEHVSDAAGASRPVDGMDVRLDRVLEEGLSFRYVYDFGSPTALELEVVAARERTFLAGPVRVVARNEPPRVACGACGEGEAVELCFEEFDEYGGRQRLCAACAARHAKGCREEHAPWPNSPRAGVCGYT